MSNTQKPLIITGARRTMLRIKFLNGREYAVAINPIVQKMHVMPDKEVVDLVDATAAMAYPEVPFGLGIVPPGGSWNVNAESTPVAQIQVSPTETDMIMRYADGSVEAVRLQHPPGAQIRIAQKPVVDPNATAGIVGPASPEA